MPVKNAIAMRRLPIYDRSQLAVAGYVIKCLVVVTATFSLSVCPLNRMKMALTLLFTNLVLSLLTLFLCTNLCFSRTVYRNKAHG